MTPRSPSLNIRAAQSRSSFDAEIYKLRHLIENFYKLKEFTRIALRTDQTDQSFAAIVYLAAAVTNSR